MKGAAMGQTDDPVLTREDFMTELVSNLVETTENYLGYDEPVSFLSEVGDIMGETISAKYLAHRPPDQSDPDYIAATRVDLKARNDGAFKAVAVSEDQIEFKNSRCPFHDRGLSDAHGYARLHIEEAIATGHE